MAFVVQQDAPPIRVFAWQGGGNSGCPWTLPPSRFPNLRVPSPASLVLGDTLFCWAMLVYPLSPVDLPWSAGAVLEGVCPPPAEALALNVGFGQEA